MVDYSDDITVGIEKFKLFLSKLVTNLNFRPIQLELVDYCYENRTYIFTLSVIPKGSTEKDYYFLKINIDTGKHQLPLGKGSLINGILRYQEVKSVK